MNPFKVKFDLASPMVVPDGIRLDALIMKYYLAEIGWNDDSIPVHETWRHVELPLRKIHFEDKFYYAASHGIWDDCVIFKDRFFKRINTALLLDTEVNNINTGSGKYCSQVNEYQDIEVNSVVFYGNGDIDVCRKLLSRVDSIGGLRKHGKGMVSGFEFSETKNDTSCVLDGITTRDIPIAKNEIGKYLSKMRAGQSMELHLKQTRIVPPYHYRIKEDKIMCLGVGSKVGE